MVPQRLLAVAELAMELEQQTQLRKVDMETNHMAAAVRKIYPSLEEATWGEVPDSGWGTTVGGVLALESQHLRHLEKGVLECKGTGLERKFVLKLKCVQVGQTENLVWQRRWQWKQARKLGLDAIAIPTKLETINH